MTRHSHCSFCGTSYPPNAPWPRHCVACAQVSYLNPLPVAVLLIPVDDGLMTIRRDIEPRRGHLALPGGFIDVGESWQHAAAREAHEESGVRIDPASVTLFDAASAPDGTLLVFGLCPRMTRADLPASAPTDETSGWEVIDEPTPLAFPLHTAAAQRYFDRQND
ncbi:MAG: NUDIX domain-containing protein [Actinomycetota bacterium]|nr:NUDIX domain-containing protein [Actinomycetota bacterium]